MPSADITTVNGAGHASQSANKRRTPNIDSNHDADPSSSKRPSSAPGIKNNLAVGSLNRSSTDVSDSMVPARPTKPALLRSKSEYASLRNDEEEHTIEERREWGARHGFEDHYQSQDIISQLANVRSSCSVPHYLRPF
jgi:regulator-associated protein of mTOR